jgi:hypothetical protein
MRSHLYHNIGAIGRTKFWPNRGQLFGFSHMRPDQPIASSFVVARLRGSLAELQWKENCELPWKEPALSCKWPHRQFPLAKQGGRGPAHMHGSLNTGYRVTRDALAGANLPEALFCQMISDEPDESLGSD